MRTVNLCYKSWPMIFDAQPIYSNIDQSKAIARSFMCSKQHFSLHSSASHSNASLNTNHFSKFSSACVRASVFMGECFSLSEIAANRSRNWFDAQNKVQLISRWSKRARRKHMKMKLKGENESDDSDTEFNAQSTISSFLLLFEENRQWHRQQQQQCQLQNNNNGYTATKSKGK